MSERPLLVIGVGNPARGDDGVGPATVAAARADQRLDDIETMVAGGDLSDLVVTWRPDDDVVVVDAMVSGRPVGTVVAIDGLAEPLPLTNGLLSSHGFGLAATIEVARRLDLLPRTLTILAVEIGEIDTLQPLSGPVRSALVDVVDRIAAEAADRRAERTGDKDGDERPCPGPHGADHNAVRPTPFVDQAEE